jgi:hypothetical protein
MLAGELSRVAVSWPSELLLAVSIVYHLNTVGEWTLEEVLIPKNCVDNFSKIGIYIICCFWTRLRQEDCQETR